VTLNLAEGNGFVGKEMECPADVSNQWFATGEFEEAGFGVVVEFAVVLPVGLVAMNLN
jgi:hypothetical protein